MTHLTRVGLIVIAIFAAIVFLREVPVPPVMEKYGFYREIDNSQEWAGQPAQYADPSDCGSCHGQRLQVWQSSSHSTVICEDCHGPGIPHMEIGARLIIDTTRESCATCHETVLGRGAEFPQVSLLEHGEDLECATCHDPHAPALSVAPLVSHTLEGRSECLTCHGTAGFLSLPPDHDSRDQETCLSCHDLI